MRKERREKLREKEERSGAQGKRRRGGTWDGDGVLRGDLSGELKGRASEDGSGDAPHWHMFPLIDKLIEGTEG